MKKSIIILFLLLIVCVACTKRTVVENEELQGAISQVWLDADAAQEMLVGLDTNDLSEYEMQRYRLAEAHLMLKRELRLPNSSDLEAILFFGNKTH